MISPVHIENDVGNNGERRQLELDRLSLTDNEWSIDEIVWNNQELKIRFNNWNLENIHSIVFARSDGSIVNALKIEDAKMSVDSTGNGRVLIWNGLMDASALWELDEELLMRI